VGILYLSSMKYIITERQYGVILEQYNPNELYSKDYIIRILKGKGKMFNKIIEKLPNIPCYNQNGVEMICTTIPEVAYVYMTGRY
jgi:hypothetical protein